MAVGGLSGLLLALGLSIRMHFTISMLWYLKSCMFTAQNDFFFQNSRKWFLVKTSFFTFFFFFFVLFVFVVVAKIIVFSIPSIVLKNDLVWVKYLHWMMLKHLNKENWCEENLMGEQFVLWHFNDELLQKIFANFLFLPSADCVHEAAVRSLGILMSVRLIFSPRCNNRKGTQSCF